LSHSASLKYVNFQFHSYFVFVVEVICAWGKQFVVKCENLSPVMNPILWGLPPLALLFYSFWSFLSSSKLHADAPFMFWLTFTILRTCLLSHPFTQYWCMEVTSFKLFYLGFKAS
jgi:hypothetical protein